jgi:hypothetical protein
MIVRILGEGRYDVTDSELPTIEQLDRQLVEALDRGDEDKFGLVLVDLIGEVRRVGTLLPADDLRPSELVVPNDGSTMSEVKALLAEEG